MKEEVGGLVVGGFEPDAKPWVPPDQIPYPFEFQLLDEDWEHFSLLLESAVHRVPVLEQTGLKKLYNGPESFTPDNQFLLGEAPELRASSSALALTRSASRQPVERGKPWLSGSWAGEPASDLVAVDIRRFAPWSGEPSDGCATGSSRCLGCTTRSHGPTVSSHRPARFVVRRCTDLLGRAGRNVRLEDGVGTRRMSLLLPAADRELAYTWEQAGVVAMVV